MTAQMTPQELRVTVSVIWAGLVLLTVMLAVLRGRNGWRWGLGALLLPMLTPVFWVFLVLLPSQRRRRCPYCTWKVSVLATRCPHYTAEL